MRTTPVEIWPNEVATVTYTLVFDNTHEPFTYLRENVNPHRIPTDVTQYYTYGHPYCGNVLGRCQPGSYLLLDACLTIWSTISAYNNILYDIKYYPLME